VTPDKMNGAARQAGKPEGTAGADRPSNLRVVLEARERQVERAACWLRIGVASVASLSDAALAISAGTTRLALFALVVGTTYVALMAGFLRLLRRERYHPWLKYLTTTIDFAVVTGLTVAYLHEAGPETPLFETVAVAMIAFVPLINLLSALRVGRAIIMFGTLLTCVSVVVISVTLGRGAAALGYALGLALASGVLAWTISSSTAEVLLRLARRNQLTRFLPREVVEQVDRGELDLKLGGVDQTVTILMSDIRGFTTLSESRTPTEVVQQLNEYFTVMSRIVLDHGGSIDKYVGDAILAVFGLPAPRPDDAQRALDAAQEMLHALERLDRTWEARGMPALRIGIGLHTGNAVAGNVGSPERMDYTVIGDTVNVASRIEGLTKSYQVPVLVSETTRRAVGESPVFSLVDNASIRGRQGTIRLYSPEAMNGLCPTSVSDAHFFGETKSLTPA